MRQAQQNRRGRGRNNNNRKSQNPLTRSYESNGPDVKIRGTPSHIAEKYVAMARDALSSGDPVLAENYLQHAEHYNRIIMTHREQQSSHGHDASQGGQIGRHRNPGDPIDEEQPNVEDSGDEAAGEVKAPRGSEPQPEIAANDRAAEERRPQRRTPRRERNADRERAPERESRAAGDAERPATEQPAAARANGRGGRRTRYAQTDDQPEFLKRPVRRPRATRAAEPEEAPVAAAAENSDQAAE
ncbi:MAG: DUF4167 domain-containing protein [Hyphomicrobiaceae bacterium]